MANDLLSGGYVEPVVVTRATAADMYVKGQRVAGATTTLTVQACVRPLEAAEIIQLELGEHVKEAIQLYTLTALNIASETAKTPADELAWNGSAWKVHKVRHRTQIAALAHYDCLAVRVEGT